jgi:hypothetical protein
MKLKNRQPCRVGHKLPGWGGPLQGRPVRSGDVHAAQGGLGGAHDQLVGVGRPLVVAQPPLSGSLLARWRAHERLDLLGRLQLGILESVDGLAGVVLGDGTAEDAVGGEVELQLGPEDLLVGGPHELVALCVGRLIRVVHMERPNVRFVTVERFDDRPTVPLQERHRETGLVEDDRVGALEALLATAADVEIPAMEPSPTPPGVARGLDLGGRLRVATHCQLPLQQEQVLLQLGGAGGEGDVEQCSLS